LILARLSVTIVVIELLSLAVMPELRGVLKPSSPRSPSLDMPLPLNLGYYDNLEEKKINLGGGGGSLYRLLSGN
jgi:hypothetical protein